MLSMLKRLAPQRVRHRLVHGLPREVQHRLVDAYVSYAGKQRIQPFSDEPAEFWRDTVNRTNDAPPAYAHATTRWDVQFLKSRVDSLIGKGRVLDFGCNAGRALHVFADAGYATVGVEINPNAVELARKTFASLRDGEFHVGDGASVLQRLPDDYSDFSYTLAVLRHVSPNSIHTICEQIGRVSKRYIATFEDEGSMSPLTFARNYRKIFEPLGWKQIQKEYAIGMRPEVDIGGIGTIFRLFQRASDLSAAAYEPSRQQSHAE